MVTQRPPFKRPSQCVTIAVFPYGRLIERISGSLALLWAHTLPITEYAKDAAVVVLASGDGGFDLLVEKIRKDLNALVEVYGVPKFTSTSLISSASKYISITKNLLLEASKR